MGEQAIPILPCPSVPEVLRFYNALGFETTFEQTRPNPFASLRYGEVDLQFFGHRAVVPEESWSTCYLVTDRVDELYAAFRAGLKAAYGRVPTRGIPRVGQIRDTSYGMRQFVVTDPGGNCLRVGQAIGDDMRHGPVPKARFARALHNAWLQGISKQEPARGARILDHALAHETPATPVERIRALVLRADLADQLGEDGLAVRLLAEARAAAPGLGAADREALRDDLLRAADLEQSLREE
ncbi:hypothetical protein GCM10027168_14340 [Streptomyces capparidis]